MHAPGTTLRALSGAALIGAALSVGACGFLSWTAQRSKQVCRTVDGFCFSWWQVAALPLTLTTAFVVLAVFYKRLGIRPRSVIVPPTVLLGAIPLAAAPNADWWAAALVGAAWSSSFALAAWPRHRPLALVSSAGLLLGSLVALYP
ncbi:hypothetical protein ACVNF4_16565 [Streptomyces sp. S6]